MFENKTLADAQTYVAVVGATGLVGEAILSHLASRGLPLERVKALASKDSLGKRVDYGDTGAWVDELDSFDFSQVDIALFAVPEGVAREWIPRVLEAGCRVVDASPVYRNDPEVPLVVVELNGETLLTADTRLVSLPGAVAHQVAVSVPPMVGDVYVHRILVNAFESVSAHGRETMQELASQTVDMLSGKPPKLEAFERQVAFNLLPAIGGLDEAGDSSEESSVRAEVRRLLDDELLPVDVLAVQAPVFFGHSTYVEVEVAESMDDAAMRTRLRTASGVRLSERGKFSQQPSAVTDAVGTDTTVVGRLRLEPEEKRRVSAWLVSDNVKTAAAKNSVSVCEILIKGFE